ncbi:MAG: hypothetical protein FWE88_01880 [Phycisphaerae bacterium]|nr:hypothetical protein [Phycisphaerae bacterium]
MVDMRTMLSRAVMNGVISRVGRGFTAQVRRELRAFGRAQWRPYAQLRELQLEGVNRLLSHCVRTVPYYRRMHVQGLLPDRIGRLEELSQVPTLSKETLVAQGEEFVSSTVAPGALLPRRSGGSTGEPLHFFITPHAAAVMAACEHYGNSLAGHCVGDPIATLWGSRFDNAPPTFRQRAARYLSNITQCVVDRMDEAVCRDIVRRLERQKPTVLVGYTAALMEMAAFLEDRGLRPNFPKRSVISAAEPLTPSQRQTLERVFGRSVFNRYGTREVGLVAMECSYHRGLHLNGHSLYVEFEPVAGLGDARRVIVTKLFEMGMPFIRYDLGDYILGDVSACPCGRGFPIIQAVRGRVVSNLRLPNGAFIAPEVFIVLLDRQSVREYRVVQAADYSARVEIVPGPHWDDTMAQHVLRTLHGVTLGLVEFRIELRERVERTPSGKLLPIVSHVPSPVETAPLAWEAIRAA